MKNYSNQVEQYNEFNNELNRGIKSNLSLYNPSYDKTLYKDVNDIPKPKPSEEAKQAQKFLDNYKHPVIFGDLGEDIYNFFTKKDEPFRSKTIEFYNEGIVQPVYDEISKNSSKEFYKLLGIVIIGLFVYKKI